MILLKLQKTFKILIIGLITTSCLSLNKPDSSGSSVNNSSSTNLGDISTSDKVKRAVQNINGNTFSIAGTKRLVIDSSSNPKKLASTKLVVLGDGKVILISGPGSIINNKTIPDNDYSFFEIKEASNGKTRSSIVNSNNNNILNYKLAL
jgi:hypothetical protein